MSAKPEILTWLEAISIARWSNEMDASIPHFAVGADNPGDGYVAMWSNEIIVDEIADIEYFGDDDEDPLATFDFILDMEDE